MTAQRYRFTAGDMERIRAVVLEGRKAYDLARCSPTFRIIDGEKFATGFTFGRLQMGVDFSTILDRMDTSAGHHRTMQFISWCEGMPFSEFAPIARWQLEHECAMFRDLAEQGGYGAMFR